MMIDGGRKMQKNANIFMYTSTYWHTNTAWTDNKRRDDRCLMDWDITLQHIYQFIFIFIYIYIYFFLHIYIEREID